MLTAVQGYYDGSQIILNEKLPLTNGQKVILTVFENDTGTKDADASAYGINQAFTTDEAEWQSFMQGIDSFTEDFMPNGRETEIPSARESL